MEQKKVNLSLLYSLILFGIGMAFKSIATYFGGILSPIGSYGIPFVAILVFTVLILANGFKKVGNRRRLIDIFILVGISLMFALVAFCSTEWVSQLEVTTKDVKFINEWCIAYSIFSTVFLVYGLLRYISETGDKKWTVFEILLGTKKVERKARLQEKYSRQPKDVVSGDFEEKPNHVQEERVETAKEKVEPEENNETAESNNETVETNSNSNYNQY